RGASRRPIADLPHPGMPTSTIDLEPSLWRIPSSRVSSFLLPGANRIIATWKIELAVCASMSKTFDLDQIHQGLDRLRAECATRALIGICEALDGT
ncbi:MAG: hypothetical protein M3N38_08820, partial [Pseudomonadota bacterium]|nr:hypothetical protein [Pseudomonadota bacterium]